MLAGLLMLKKQRNLPKNPIYNTNAENSTLLQLDEWILGLKQELKLAFVEVKEMSFTTCRSTDCELLTSNTGITTFVISVMVGAIQSQKSFRLWRKRRHFLFLFFLLSFWWECLSPSPPPRKEYWWRKVHGNDNNDDTMMLMTTMIMIMIMMMMMMMTMTMTMTMTMMMMMMMIMMMMMMMVVVVVKKMTMTKNLRKDA